MIKAIIFDVDGTLIDNINALTKGWQLFAEKLNLKRPTKEDIRENIGIPYYEMSVKFWPQFNPYEHDKLFEECIKTVRKTMKPVIQREEVENLRKSFKIGIVTSARRKSLDSYIGEIKDLFEIIITADDVKNRKPNPDPLILCCKKLGVDVKQVLYTGDSIFDFMCARDSNSEFVGVLTGACTKDDFKKLNIPYITSVKEIYDYAVKLNESRSDRKIETSRKNSK